MDLLPGALVVQQQRTQERWQRNAPEYAAMPPSRKVSRPRRAVRRGVGRTLIAVGAVLVYWAEPTPSRLSQPIQYT